MSLLLHALVIARTVSLHKLAGFMPTEVGTGSNIRRIQRFLWGYILDLDLVERMIFSLLPVYEKTLLSMDRTDWKFGIFNINILMLGVTYRNVAFPILFRLMPKRGNFPNGLKERSLWKDSSGSSARTVSTVLWLTGSLSARNGSAGLTASDSGTISGSGRISRLPKAIPKVR